MDLWILDNELNQVGVLDDYTSLIWSKRYSALGDCEIYISANPRTIDLLQKGYFITRVDDDMICRIETVEIDTDTDQGDFLIVTGYDCRKILNQRIVWTQTNFTGTVENFIRKIVTENVISPETSVRRISNLKLGQTKGFTESIEIQSTYDYLFDKIQELCQTYGYGSKITFDGTDFYFDLYVGVDRSLDQDENEVVVFSPEFENLISTRYSSDSSNLKTAALVAGEGEGTERVRQEIAGGSGIDRFELFVDAKDISTTTDDVTLTEEEYRELLKQRGNEKLAEHVTVVSFDGAVEPNYSYKYGEDYFLGDIVTIKNKYGISANARVIEVIESDDDGGYSLIPTFEFIEVNEPPISTTALLTESEEPLTTESGEQIVAETPMLLSSTPRSTSGVGIPISELPESTGVYDGCCMPIVTNGETKKIFFSMLKEAFLDAAYPVGKVYMSVDSTDPSTLFGGTWERIKDTFLLAAGDTYSAGSSGGEATHKLTAAESGIPAHTHRATQHVIKTAATGSVKWHTAPKASSTSSYSDAVEISNNTAKDATNAHNNMPPYTTVYMWKRTA